MNTTFAKEDARKNKLFEEWIKHLRAVYAKFQQKDFQKFYEGMAKFSELGENRFDLVLDGGKKIKALEVTPEICAHSRAEDSMYIMIGRRGDKYWPLDVISVGTLLGGTPCKMHVTYNPLYVNPLMAPSQFAH